MAVLLSGANEGRLLKGGGSLNVWLGVDCVEKVFSCAS
jgi:hypothetical protein